MLKVFCPYSKEKLINGLLASRLPFILMVPIERSAMKIATDLLVRIETLLNNLGGGNAPLDHVSRNILLHVANKQASGEQLQMSDIRFNEQFGSQATALKRLQKLINQGWLSTTRDPLDGRAQLVCITPKAARQIESVSEQIIQAVTERSALNDR